MNYVKLGNTGMDVSPICLGCMSFGTTEGWFHNPWALNEADSRPPASGRVAHPLTATTTRLETDPIAKSKYDATAAADTVIIERVAEVTAQHGVPMGHVALAWLLQKAPVVAPVIGATKLSHLESAVEALTTKLTAEEVAFLEEPYVPHGVVGHN